MEKKALNILLPVDIIEKTRALAEKEMLNLTTYILILLRKNIDREEG